MNLTIARLAWQALCGRKRFWAMLVIPLTVVALTLIVAAFTGDDPQRALSVVNSLGFATALPLVALLITSSVLGPEIDDGSVVYVLSKPISRPVVALSKYVVAWVATLLFAVLPLAGAALIADSGRPRNAVAFLAAGALCGAAYCALFLLLSAFTRYGVVLGLLYAFVWEAAMSNFLQGIGRFSVQAWGRSLLNTLGTLAQPSKQNFSVTYALLASAVVVIVGVALAGQRLRSLSLAAEE